MLHICSVSANFIINNKVVIWDNGRISGINNFIDNNQNREDRMFMDGMVKGIFQSVIKNGGTENGLQMSTT